ncbi:hypothetical protein JNJ66_04495 [Candidatus Saccharibacteria bacterium]|nr:hypothetical protein [Candidatus Saccharibacteria bacterium]
MRIKSRLLAILLLVGAILTGGIITPPTAFAEGPWDPKQGTCPSGWYDQRPVANHCVAVISPDFLDITTTAGGASIGSIGGVQGAVVGAAIGEAAAFILKKNPNGCIYIQANNPWDPTWATRPWEWRWYVGACDGSAMWRHALS